MSQAPREGVLLVQLGTPDAPDVAAVRRYLRTFLMDPRVIDLPFPARWLLVHGVIAPFRAPRSAEAYRRIWTDAGGPLRVYTEALGEALARRIRRPVAVAMRYGAPSIGAGLAALADCDEIVVVPLYPQYASASAGSAIGAVLGAAAGERAIPALRFTRPLAQYPGWAEVVAGLARPLLDGADAVVCSYHGLPERQVRATRPGCLVDPACCVRPDAALGFCYRAQCLASTRSIGAALGRTGLHTCFQSRLGREAWLGPSLDTTLDRLVAEGAREIVVLTPSFVADCLETLEEVGIQARARLAAAGAHLRLVPCLNADPAWVEVLARVVGEAGSTGPPR